MSKLFEKLRLLYILPIIMAFVAYPRTGAAETPIEPGATAPAFTLKNQDKADQTLRSLAGPNGLLVLFSRSADWCGLCKSQLIDLESARRDFEAHGIHIASVTYDSPEVLKAFATRRGIHFTLLSDPDSATIDAFGVRNPEATGYQAGIAIPNYYLIAPDGKILKRFVEGKPEERTTAGYLFEAIYGVGAANRSADAVVPSTPHLKVTLAQSDLSVPLGARTRATVKLAPGKGEHLYAPGAETFGYRPIRLTLNPSESYSTKPVLYGKSTILEFPKLKESVPVFETSTQVSQEVWPTALPKAKGATGSSSDSTLVVNGVLEYQVCNATTCFPPQKADVSWKFQVVPFDRVRVAEALQRK